MNRTSFDQLTCAAFSALVKTRFLVRADGASSIELELGEVRQLPAGRPPGAAGPVASNESFSLRFDGPASRYLAQGTYELEHEQMGQFALFLVPIGKNEQGFQYQAVFNRLT